MLHQKNITTIKGRHSIVWSTVLESQSLFVLLKLQDLALSLAPAPVLALFLAPALSLSLAPAPDLSLFLALSPDLDCLCFSVSSPISGTKGVLYNWNLQFQSSAQKSFLNLSAWAMFQSILLPSMPCQTMYPKKVYLMDLSTETEGMCSCSHLLSTLNRKTQISFQKPYDPTMLKR